MYVCMIACFLFWGRGVVFCTLSFVSRLLILAYMVQCCRPVSVLSASLTPDPFPFQGGVCSPGAGTNTACAETVPRPMSLSHSSFPVSDLFSLAVGPDTLWPCALRRLAQDKTLRRLHFSNIGAGTFIIYYSACYNQRLRVNSKNRMTLRMNTFIFTDLQLAYESFASLICDHFKCL